MTSFLLILANRHIARAVLLFVLHQGDQGLSGGQTQDKSIKRKIIINNKTIFIIHHNAILNFKHYFSNNFFFIHPTKMPTVCAFSLVVSDDKKNISVS